MLFSDENKVLDVKFLQLLALKNLLKSNNHQEALKLLDSLPPFDLRTNIGSSPFSISVAKYANSHILNKLFEKCFPADAFLQQEDEHMIAALKKGNIEAVEFMLERYGALILSNTVRKKFILRNGVWIDIAMKYITPELLLLNSSDVDGKQYVQLKYQNKLNSKTFEWPYNDYMIEELVKLCIQKSLSNWNESEVMGWLLCAKEKHALQLLKIPSIGQELSKPMFLLSCKRRWDAVADQLLTQFPQVLGSIYEGEETCLHVIINNQRSCSAPEFIQLLVKHGADKFILNGQTRLIDAQDVNGETVMHRASSSETLEALLAFNPDLSILSNQGASVFHEMVQNDLCKNWLRILTKGHTENMDLFMNLKDKEGKTPMDYLSYSFYEIPIVAAAIGANKLLEVMLMRGVDKAVASAAVPLLLGLGADYKILQSSTILEHALMTHDSSSFVPNMMLRCGTTPPSSFPSLTEQVLLPDNLELLLQHYQSIPPEAIDELLSHILQMRDGSEEKREDIFIQLCDKMKKSHHPKAIQHLISASDFDLLQTFIFHGAVSLQLAKQKIGSLLRKNRFLVGNIAPFVIPLFSKKEWKSFGLKDFSCILQRIMKRYGQRYIYLGTCKIVCRLLEFGAQVEKEPFTPNHVGWYSPQVLEKLFLYGQCSPTGSPERTTVEGYEKAEILFRFFPDFFIVEGVKTSSLKHCFQVHLVATMKLSDITIVTCERDCS